MLGGVYEAEAARARAGVGPGVAGQHARLRAGRQHERPAHGTVVDASGAPVPGASVVVKNEGTGATYQAVSGEKGTFAVPALQAGTYTVTVSLSGFKQSVTRGFKILAATPAALRATLEVGGLEETVTVEATGAPLVQTQSTAISTTVEVGQINNLPRRSRATRSTSSPVMPGVSTPGGARDSIVSGLDQSAINITIDGMSVQDNYLKTTDGFFARLSPRLDAVEEVTMTTAGGGAETSGQGAVQIRFVSRQGTNEYHGSALRVLPARLRSTPTRGSTTATCLRPEDGQGADREAEVRQLRRPLRRSDPHPGRSSTGATRRSSSSTTRRSRTARRREPPRTILSPSAQQGIFRYNTTCGVREVNLLQLAGANGQTSTIDPDHREAPGRHPQRAAGQGGVADLTDPLVQRFTLPGRRSATSRATRTRGSTSSSPTSTA